jgi:hypothetical protein
VDAKPGYPDRIEVRDAEPGESVLLLNYTHQPPTTRIAESCHPCWRARAPHTIASTNSGRDAHSADIAACLRLDARWSTPMVSRRHELERLIERFWPIRAWPICTHYARRLLRGRRVDRASATRAEPGRLRPARFPALSDSPSASIKRRANPPPPASSCRSTRTPRQPAARSRMIRPAHDVDGRTFVAQPEIRGSAVISTGVAMVSLSATQSARFLALNRRYTSSFNQDP